MQDAPFLVLRLLLIFKYGVVSYTNMFFTCKNTLVCLLLIYRLVVIHVERYQNAHPDADLKPSRDSIGLKLVVSAENSDQYYRYVTKVDLRESRPPVNEPDYNYVIRCHISDRGGGSRSSSRCDVQSAVTPAGVGGAPSMWWSYHNIEADRTSQDQSHDDDDDERQLREKDLHQSDSALYLRS